MKTCSNCFASMDAFASACPSCGFQAQTTAFTQFEEPKRFRLPRISVKVVAIAAAAIVAVAGAGFVATNLPFDRGIKLDEGLVPILVGYPATDAFAAAEEIGFDVHAETEAREYILGSGDELQAKLIGQFVCYQSQLAGTSIVPNADLALVIAATCEGREPSMLAGKYAADAGVWSPATPNQPNALDNAELEGWVVGYGDKYSPQNVTVLTAYGEVDLKLAMIEPTSTSRRLLSATLCCLSEPRFELFSQPALATMPASCIDWVQMAPSWMDLHRRTQLMSS